LTLFESVVRRDFLSSNYSATEELLGSSNPSGIALHDYSDPASVPVLPWIPQTIAAVALRLFDLDAAIAYVPEEKPEPTEDKELREYIVSLTLSLSLSLPVEYFLKSCFPLVPKNSS